MRQNVFISHITEEAPIAQSLKSFIAQAFGDKFRVFVSSDYDSIRGGENWFETIIGAMKSSDVVLVLVSKESVDRRWINFEAGIGIGAGARVIPLVIKNISKGGVGLPLSSLQTRDLHDPRDVEGMIRDVALAAGATPPSVDAPLFARQIKEIALGLPYRGVALKPLIEPTTQSDFLLVFELSNTGNQDVQLIQLEAAVPKAIVSPEWRIWLDPRVLEHFEKEISGEVYLVLRYKDYRGDINPGTYYPVDLLPEFALRGMEPTILKPLTFSIRKSAAHQRKSALILYKVRARDIDPITTETPLSEISGFPMR
jgi:hypothetical protein